MDPRNHRPFADSAPDPWPGARDPFPAGSPPPLLPPAAPGRSRIRLNVVLFLATVLTTMIAGAFHKGVDPFASPGNLLQGIPFSAALLSILLAHEMGHYLTSRRYGVAASLPYFIPVPTFIGTMGAIIRMRSVIRNRRVLFDIGIAGPLWGMAVAVPVTVIGLLLSRLVTVGPESGGISLGDSLLFKLLIGWIFGDFPEWQTVELHPVAFAGWLGFFVTSLNLIPIGQLDGGHVAYGIIGPHHRLLSRVVFVCLLLWGLHGAFTVFEPLQWLWAVAFFWLAIRTAFHTQPGYLLRGLTLLLLGIGITRTYVPDTMVWVFWATLMCFLKLDHPPTHDVRVPLDRRRKVLGWIALALFLLTFIPSPFQGIP